MANSDARIYAVIFANFTAGSVSESNWDLLINATKIQPLSAAILNAAKDRGAEKFITARKRSQNPTYLRLYTLIGFEVSGEDLPALLNVLDTQAVFYGVTGNNRTKFTGVLQGELRTAAIGLGYTQTNANKLSVTLINEDIPNTFDRYVAISQAQLYLQNNAHIWYNGV